MSWTATVAFVALRNDLANLPISLTGSLFNANTPAQDVVVELCHQAGLRTERKVYLGWTGMSSKSPDTVEVDPTFAQNSHLRHNVEVTVRVHAKVPAVHTVHLEPVTTADWEIVETHVGFLETWMINQVRAVSIGHAVTVYPSPTAIACLLVTKIEPAPSGPFARLSPNSEVIVAPKVHQSTPTTEKLMKKTPSRKAPDRVAVVRASSFPYGPVIQTENTDAKAATRQLILYGYISEFNTGDLIKVSVVNPPGLNDSTPKPEKVEEAVPHAKTVIARFIQDEHFSTPVLSYGLMCALRVPARVALVVKVVKVAQFSRDLGRKNVIIHPYSTTNSSASLKLGGKDATENSLSNKILSDLFLDLVTNGMSIGPSQAIPSGALIECDSEFCEAAGATVGAERITGESQLLPAVEKCVLELPDRKVVGRDSVIAKAQESCLNLSGTLLYGTRGCGKSSILENVVRDLEKQLVAAIHFNCSNYADKGVAVAREALKKAFLEASWYAPAVVIFENLEQLIPAARENSDSSRTTQLVEIFIQLAVNTMRTRQVTVFATTQAKEALNSLLMSSHVFEELVHVTSPDKRVREAILTEAMSSLDLKGNAGFDILEVVGDTEGYQPGDLWILTERVTAAMALEQGAPAGNSDGNQLVGLDLFKKAMKDFTPAALRGVKGQAPSTNWAEIGGLNEVKRIILETLDWPTKYAPIFANCPLRLRSGLLLYGYPGCGKTLIASAIAAKTGLNFISVKGPEILNKYIGASEQSVRELFDRAQAAKPCILFFDEFDSIAPKRGHDSTGVTDRVVNQMLTQMDGAEGLDGVYVLAATSRPDLIDSALLRPGRLDKALLCDMPSYEDRLEILAGVKSKMNLGGNVDLPKIAKTTHGFSGADLQAVMTNAYLDAIHSIVDTIEPSDGNEHEARDINMFHVGSTRDIEIENVKNYIAASTLLDDADENKQPAKESLAVVVTAAHIQKALHDTNPSISSKELSKLQKIYKEFVADRDGEMPPGTSSTDIGGRVTLS